MFSQLYARNKPSCFRANNSFFTYVVYFISGCLQRWVYYWIERSHYCYTTSTLALVYVRTYVRTIQMKNTFAKKEEHLVSQKQTDGSFFRNAAAVILRTTVQKHFFRFPKRHDHQFRINFGCAKQLAALQMPGWIFKQTEKPTSHWERNS